MCNYGLKGILCRGVQGPVGKNSDTEWHCCTNCIGGSLTYDDNDNHEDDDNQDDPEFDVLPPELTFEPRGCTLKHVSILVEVICEPEGAQNVSLTHIQCTCKTTSKRQLTKPGYQGRTQLFCSGVAIVKYYMRSVCKNFNPYSKIH